MTLGSTFATGLAPSDLALGDFDGDLELDIVTSNASGDDVTILLGAGDGTFGGPTPFDVGSDPSAIDVGDFDGNGDLDVVVANTLDGTVSLLLGLGDGTFAAQTTFAAGGAPTDLVTADYGAGSEDDVAVVSSADDTIRILAGGPGGVLIPSAPASVIAGSALGIAAGEFNGDMMTDAAVVGAGGNWHGWAGNDAGGFFADISGSFGGNLVRAVAADVDDDGTTDLVIADVAADAVQIQAGDGMAMFSLDETLTVGPDPADVAVGELNGDPLLEIAVVDATDVTIFNHVAGVYTADFVAPTGGTASALAIGDVNGDGVPDVVVTVQSTDLVLVIASDP